ncbi:hypothetical protein F2Q69_00023921 [Brassica cretica]|uniref:Uncharacterized protein n=2 Tax=Brassica TaxID=3705 RepID=A0A0D3AUJ1_BRAOL|nr:hypothetical protein F2Q69_00023921 [Brassica cretica]
MNQASCFIVTCSCLEMMNQHNRHEKEGFSPISTSFPNGEALMGYQCDVPRFVDQSIGASQHGDHDVLNNLIEVRSTNRTDQTDRAVARASRLELRLEPRPDDRTDRTTARLPRPTLHSKTHGRARLSLGREEAEDGHAFLSGGPSGQSSKRPYLYPVHPSGSVEPGHYMKGHL